MAQTSYSNMSKGFAGQLGDSDPGARLESNLNAEGAAIPAGVAVVQSAEGQIDLLDNSADKILGIVVNSFSRDPSATLSGIEAIPAGAVCDVLVRGAIRVHVEENVAVGDPVYARHTANGGNTILGKFRNDADTASCVLVKGARFLTAGSTTQPPLVYFDVAAAQT